jgi:zinc protease
MKKICIFIMIFCSACATQAVNSSEKEIMRDVVVRMAAPDTGWAIKIREIYQVNEEIWVISSLNRRQGMAAQSITNVSDAISMSLPEMPVKHFVLGKTWKWRNNEPYTILKGLDEIKADLESGRLLYKKDAQE